MLLRLCGVRTADCLNMILVSLNIGVAIGITKLLKMDIAVTENRRCSEQNDVSDTNVGNIMIAERLLQ